MWIKNILKRLIHHVRDMKYLNRWIIFFCDLLISLFSTICICFGFTIYLNIGITLQNFYITILVATIASAASILLFKSYCNIIRYSNLREVWWLLLMCMTKDVMIGITFITIGLLSFEDALLFAFSDFLLTFVMLISVRLVILNLYNILILSGFTKKKNIWIYGTGRSSVSLAMGNNNIYLGDYVVRGFLVKEANVGRLRISEYKIHSVQTIEELKKEVEANRIEAILFPNMHSLQSQKEDILAMCVKLKIAVLVVPNMEEMRDGKIHNSIRPIKIEDLLGRNEININMQEVCAAFSNKVILVTGAAGSIGSELCRQLAGMGIKQLLLYDNAETPMHEIRLELEQSFPKLKFLPLLGDIREKERLKLLFEKYHPQVVFQAAAYKHVPLMEENPCEAIRVNVYGTRILSDLCVEYDVEKMIMVSTDKAVNPTNIMGASKRLAEIYTQALGRAIENGEINGKTKFVTTRFGNVLGSNGSVIPYFRKEIEEGGPVTVTHPEITRFFMTIPEACRLVMEAACIAMGNEIVVFDMGKSIKIIELAEKMIRLAGFTPYKDIDIKIIGLRPGEKLYEEVLSSEENTIPTRYEKIRIAKAREYKYFEILEDYDRLATLAKDVQTEKMVILMKKLLPEFVSNNSWFEKLDKHKIIVKNCNN